MDEKGKRQNWRHAYCCMGKYLKELAPMRWLVALAVLLGCLSGFTGGFGGPVLMKYVIRNAFFSENSSALRLAYYFSLPIFLIGVRSLLGFLNTYCVAMLGQSILRSIREKVFGKLQRLPLGFFRQTRSGQLISRAFNDTNVIQSCFVSIAHEVVQRPATLLSAVGAVIYLCLRQGGGWTLLLLLTLVSVSGLPIAILGRKVWARNLRAQESIAELTSQMASNLQSVQEVRAFCQERQESLKFRRANRAYSRSYLAACRAYYLIVPCVQIWASIGISLALFYAYCARIPGETFLAIALALYLSYDHIKHVGRLYGNLQSAVAALFRIECLLEEQEVDDNATVELPADGRLRGAISFREVGFSYEPNKPIFQKFSLELEPGRSYALVGPNGAGKTTLANLILRFYDVQEGSIAVDGRNIRSLGLEQLRSDIALVPQQSTLLHDSIAANIRWGCPTASREQVLEAARRARALEFIEQLPRGLDTVIGEDGGRLSGGQRQRIALARAFLKNAPILIMDEATSSLDSESVRDIRDVLPELFRGRTVLLISHHSHWLLHVDEIIVLDGGIVVQRGSHGELLARDGLYSSLYATHHES
ncbi:MAG: ABC transporter ATP-binding protein/permease [Puniceicoccales bacterium]|jgi:subfamily B ATP-binding cassette protein MsbA|nr:ABC transporter ATP-binding protein/permease [Puniceicoccales bacterium]